MFCDNGKVCYATVKEASTEVANLNKHDKKHKHNYYKCSICKMFHTSTIRKAKKIARKLEKYKFRYVPPLKEEVPVKKKKKFKKPRT